MHAPVVPTLGIHRVGAKYLQFAAFDFGGQHSNHAPVFVLKEFPHRSGKDHQRNSRVAENKSFHVAVQFLAIGFVIFAIHREGKRLPLML